MNGDPRRHDSRVDLRSYSYLAAGLAEAGKQRSFGKRSVQPKSINQRRYLSLQTIENSDMVFGVSPAGTGKTYLAVAMGIAALVSKRVNRIVLLTR